MFVAMFFFFWIRLPWMMQLSQPQKERAKWVSRSRAAEGQTGMFFLEGRVQCTFRPSSVSFYWHTVTTLSHTAVTLWHPPWRPPPAPSVVLVVVGILKRPFF